MISGTGIDLVEKERIANSIRRFGDRFTSRILTPKEQAECESKGDRIGSIAARFAAKEALFKAVGTGWAKGVGWQDVEVLTDPTGKPVVHVHGEVAALVQGHRIHLSISHERHLSIAFVIIEKIGE